MKLFYWAAFDSIHWYKSYLPFVEELSIAITRVKSLFHQGICIENKTTGLGFRKGKRERESFIYAAHVRAIIYSYC